MTTTQVTGDTPFREIGDTTLEAFTAELASLGSPLVPEAEATYEASRPHSKLYLYHSFVEKRHDTHYAQLPPSAKNAVALKPRGYPEETGTQGIYATFGCYADNATAMRRRYDDPELPYDDDPAMTLLAYTTAYCGVDDVDPDTGSACDPDEYVAVGLAVVNRLPDLEEEPVAEIVFGRVPHPPYQDRDIPDAQNGAWNVLGPKAVRGVVWHRMEGNLNGTDGWFRRGPDPNGGGSTSLTEYGVGVGPVDGASLDGVIYRWNDPRGKGEAGITANRAPWASGPVNGPYGDGLAFLQDNDMDANVVNRDQAAIEISGSYGSPLSEKSRQAIAAITAYWADQAKIPWDEFPIIPGKGYSFVRYHDEFCAGSGKSCPGTVVKDETGDLMARAAAILEEYQTSDAPTPEPPTPEPPPSGVDYPEGMDEDLATAWFGEVSVGGKRYAYDEGQPVSACWLDDGRETGRYPAIRAVETYGERSYWRFEGGLTIWRPNASATPAVLRG